MIESTLGFQSVQERSKPIVGPANEIMNTLRGVHSLNLFPTENRMSPDALAALATDAVHRYPLSEGETFFYGDTSGLAGVYELCGELAKEYFEAQWSCINFLSGLHAMWTVITSLCPQGSVVAHLDPTAGGHYATGTILTNLGYKTWAIPFSRSECQLDLEALDRRVRDYPPYAIYLDASTVIRLPSVTQLRKIVGPDTLICLDASHLLGLMPVLDSVIGLRAGATTVSGSTHKTFPGPQKGLLVTNSADVIHRLEERLPFAVSSAHSNSVGALAITLKELLPHKEAYASAVIANARELGSKLEEKGFRVSGKNFTFTETHQIWIEPDPGIDPIAWGRRLCLCHIRTTAVVLPSTGRPGLRLGVQELTRMGMMSEAMSEVASIFADCLKHKRSIEVVRSNVASFVSNYSSVAYVTPAG